MNLLNLRKTNTTRFILAMLFEDNVKIHHILNDNFIDSYISDFYEPKYDGYVLIVKSINEKPKNTIIEPIANYKRDEHFVFIYNIPEKYNRDLACILNGKLDSISHEYKDRLLSFWDELQDNDTEDESYKTRVYKYNKFNEIYRVRPTKY